MDNQLSKYLQKPKKWDPKSWTYKWTAIAKRVTSNWFWSMDEITNIPLPLKIVPLQKLTKLQYLNLFAQIALSAINGFNFCDLLAPNSQHGEAFDGRRMWCGWQNMEWHTHALLGDIQTQFFPQPLSPYTQASKIWHGRASHKSS